MSDPTKKGKIESLSIRMYLQEGDRYMAIASVDRCPVEPGNPESKSTNERFTGASETTVGAALASVLQTSGVLEP